MERSPNQEKLAEARALAEQGSHDDAVDSYLEIIESDVGNATAWYSLGVLYYKLNQLDLALEAFENSDNIFPYHEATVANMAALRELMEIEIDNEEIEEVAKVSTQEIEEERVFIEAKQIDSPSEGKYVGGVLTAKQLSDSGNHSAAVKLWRAMLENSPKSPEIWRGLADALLSAGYSEKSEQCRTKANRLELQDRAPEEVVGESQQIEDDDFLVLASEAAMENISSLENENIGDINEAIRWFNMGVNLSNEGNTEEALSCFDKAIGSAPKDELDIRVKAQNGRGNALYRASRFSDSIIAYHTAIQMSAESATGRVLYNMGSSYASIEMYDDAVKCFTQSLERGLEKDEHEICKKQISRCRLLSREQAKRRARATR